MSDIYHVLLDHPPHQSLGILGAKLDPSRLGRLVASRCRCCCGSSTGTAIDARALRCGLKRLPYGVQADNVLYARKQRREGYLKRGEELGRRSWGRRESKGSVGFQTVGNRGDLSRRARTCAGTRHGRERKRNVDGREGDNVWRVQERSVGTECVVDGEPERLVSELQCRAGRRPHHAICIVPSSICKVKLSAESICCVVPETL